MEVAQTIKPEVNFKQIKEIGADTKYSLFRQPMISQSSSTVSLAQSSTSRTQWVLPNRTVNLAKSYFDFSIDLTPATAGDQIWIFNDMVALIDQINIGFLNGSNIVQLNHVPYVSKIRNPLRFSHVDLMKKETTGFFHCAKGYGANLLPYTWTAVVDYNIRGIDGAALGAGATTKETELLAPQHLAMMNVVAPNPPVAVSFYKKIYLHDITEQIPIQDVYLGSQINIEVMWSGYSNIGFIGTDVANPLTGAGALPACTLSNLYLYVAIQEGEAIQKKCLDDFNNNRVRVPMDFLYTTKTSVGTGAQNLTTQLTSQFGKTLKDVSVSLFTTAGANNTKYDNSNYDGKKVGKMRTSIGTIYNDPNKISSAWQYGVEFNDYDYQRDVLQNCSYNGSRLRWANNWTRVDDFTGSQQVRDGTYDRSNMANGLNLIPFQNALLYNLEFDTIAVASDVIQVFRFGRVLKGGKDGFDFE